MKHHRKYTDYQREQIAKQQYEPYGIGKKVKINDGYDGELVIGYVSEVEKTESGLKAYVIQNDVGDITLLFKGSEMPGKDGWKLDWLLNNISIVS